MLIICIKQLNLIICSVIVCTLCLIQQYIQSQQLYAVYVELQFVMYCVCIVYTVISILYPVTVVYGIQLVDNV